MARCNICGKTIESSTPTVLIGSRSFSQGAGNGRAWVGEAPTTHFCQALAVLSVGVCQKCVSKEKNRRLATHLLVFGVSILCVFSLPLISSIIPEDFIDVLMWPILILLGYLIFRAIHSVYLLVADFFRLRNNDTASDMTVLSHYLITNKIPVRDIMAVADKVNDGKINDIIVKHSLSVTDPYFGSQFTYICDLKLYSAEKINLFGEINDKTHSYRMSRFMGLQRINQVGYEAPYHIQKETRLDAIALFEKIGVKIE